MKFEKSKSIGIIIGIVISVFLIGQQLSTLGFLTHLMGSIASHANPERSDIWVITDQTNNLNAVSPISRSLVDQLKSIEGVEQTSPVIFSTVMMKFSNGQFSSVQILGSELPQLVLGPPESDICEGQLKELANPSTVTLDINDVKNFHHPVYKGMDVEINGKHARVAALTKNVRGYGASFSYTNMENARLYTGMAPDKVSAIIVKVKERERTAEVCEVINRSFPGVKAWEKEKLVKRTVDVILKESNMGVSFASLVIFAAISGFFIIGLTLYTSTFDRVKDYGTLKAIGASNGYISRLVLMQAFLYAVIGYSISIVLLFAMKFSVSNAGLTLVFSPLLVFGLLILTLLISVGGSFFAVMKLRKLEPASVFK